MRTLTTPLNTERTADNQAWVELYDIYLSAAIDLPDGSTSNILRLCTCPGNFAFFKPSQWPEPDATQGNAATYYFWPIKREAVKSTAKSANDTLTVAFSNVSTEFAQMLADVEWGDTPVMIRKAPLKQDGTLVAADAMIVYVGQVDTARVSNEAIQFSFSSDLAQFNATLPRENMHAFCRFSWADDQCTKLRFHEENFASGVACDSGCTTTLIKSTDLSSLTVADDAPPPYREEPVTANAANDKITLVAHGLTWDQRVRITATVMPGGVSSSVWYYAYPVSVDEIYLCESPITTGTPVVNITSAGTPVSPHGLV